MEEKSEGSSSALSAPRLSNETISCFVKIEDADETRDAVIEKEEALLKQEECEHEAVAAALLKEQQERIKKLSSSCGGEIMNGSLDEPKEANPIIDKANQVGFHQRTTEEWLDVHC